MWERPLREYCESTTYTTIHINGMLEHYDANGFPGIDFDFHCQWPTNKQSSYTVTGTKGFSLLSCPSIGEDIKYCQNLGKKILITIATLDFLSSVDDGNRSALNIWNFFLGGTVPQNSGVSRPFSNAILDGVELFIESNDPNPQYYTALLKTLRGYMDLDSSKKYFIAGTSRCVYPDTFMGPGTGKPYTDVPGIFDYYNVAMLSTPNLCGWFVNMAGFYSTAITWNSWITSLSSPKPLYISIPASTDFVGDYITPTSLFSTIQQLIFNNSQLGGISLRDVSYDDINLPCGGIVGTEAAKIAVKYSSVIAAALQGSQPSCNILPETNWTAKMSSTTSTSVVVATHTKITFSSASRTQ
ncbi:hypothetical protein HK096_006568, partial [Nowakowskiella sp. JEL0078]